MGKDQIENKFIDVFTAYDGSRVRLPLMIKQSPNRGPKIFLIGVIHGEEVIGIEVIHRIFKNVRLKCGSIYAIPVANMAGFSLGVRTVPYGETADWGNLNRIFPGDEHGRPDEKIANAIYRTIVKSKPDLVIDLHADSHNSLPFVLLDRFVKKGSQKLLEKTRELAKVFGVTVCNDDDLENYIKDNSDKTLTGALFNYARIPAFVAELGGPVVIRESFVKIGTLGIKNVLAKLGMLDENWKFLAAKSRIREGHLLRTLTISAREQSGKINYKVKVGDSVREGGVIATIEDVFGKKQEEVLSPAAGYVISLGYQALSFPGITIATLAVAEI